MTELRFSPTDYGFNWTEDWYEYNPTEAEKLAKASRDREAARLRKEGKKVKKKTRKNNLLSFGGIGSGHPHIELITPIYYLYVS